VNEGIEILSAVSEPDQNSSMFIDPDALIEIN